MAEVCTLDWHINPFRADRFLDLWEPSAAKAPAYGAKSWSLTRSTDDPLAFGASSCFLTRSIDDPLLFRQVSVWDSKDDFENYWGSDEITALMRASLSRFDLTRSVSRVSTPRVITASSGATCTSASPDTEIVRGPQLERRI